MSNTRRTFFNRLGINTTKLPQTPEEFEKVQESLRNPKSGISLEIKLDDSNIEKQVFNGRNLVDWILRNYHIQQRLDAIEIAKYFKEKKLFMPFSSKNEELPFNDSIKEFYCFYEDEFDNYLSSLSVDQFLNVHNIVIGPLGVRTTDLHPILGSKIISWILKSFVDIKSRTEASRLMASFIRKGLIKEHDQLTDHYYVVKNLSSSFNEIPTSICSICSQFTCLLSVGPKITLSCGHTFHDSCLMSLPNYEMGRCSGCEKEISAITASSELDLVLPFITKILGSSNYTFKSQIENFVLEFNKKFDAKPILENINKGDNITNIMNDALGQLSVFISKLSDSLLADLRLLELQEHGREKCILTFKKFIIPKLYESLFSIYKCVNYNNDEILSQKLTFLKNSKISMKALGVLDKFCLTVDNTDNQKMASRNGFPIKKNALSEEDLTNKELYFKSLPYSVALTEFDRLSDYTDVYDKLNCLVLTLHFISNAITTYWKQKKQFNVNELTLCTDDLVAIFSYIIIHTQVPNLYSEYKFIDDFIDELAVTDEPGYCVTTIGAVLNYIIEVDVNKLLNS